MILGHDEIRERLEVAPPVTLIEGPSGVGKRLLAREAASSHAKQVFEVGVEICANMEDEHIHTVRCSVLTERVSDIILDLCLTSRSQAFIFDAGTASTNALNSLLKTLEEPPSGTYFFMHASSPVLLTVASRAQRLRVGLMDEEAIRKVLDDMGSPPDRAELATKIAGGRVGGALVAEKMLQQKPIVSHLLKAAADEDRLFLTKTLDSMLPKDAEEWAEFRRSGDLMRDRLVLDGLRRALIELRTNKPMVFIPNPILADLPNSVLDTGIALCGSKARSIILTRAIVEYLIAAVMHERKSSGTMPIPKL